MPPKKLLKSKKKKAEAKEPPFPVPRDLSVRAPIDAHDGVLGIEHADVTARIKAVHMDLVLWKISEAVRAGDLDLELSDHGIDALPDAVYELPWLQVLDVSRNRFVNDVFEDLHRLPSLRAVDLSTNLLHGPLGDAAGGLPATMEELCLDENVITALPESLAALKAMNWFSARRNLLTAFPAAVLAAWTGLAHLDLRANKLKELPAEIGNCTALETLFLANNELTSLPDTLANLPHLSVLHVQRNALTALPDALADCVSLTDLDVSFNKLAALPPVVCASLTAMRKLHAAGNKISVLPPEIGAMTALEVLSLAGNSISSLPEDVGALTNLREIYMNGNPLSSLPASVAGWTVLVEASFKGCKLKSLPAEIATAWTKVAVLDVRAKKKDTCKIAPEFKNAPLMRKVHMLGVITAKAKKKKAAKK